MWLSLPGKTKAQMQVIYPQRITQARQPMPGRFTELGTKDA
jgi:hypothetical protein